MKWLRKGNASGGEGTEPETEQRVGVMHFSIDVSPAPLRGGGGKVKLPGSGVVGNACPGVKLC